MSTNKTSNYSLNQWVKSDQVKMEDFNADNAKIDAALKAHDTSLASKASTSALNSLKTTVNGKASTSALSALQSTVTDQGTALSLRNCRFYTGSYQGTGAGKPITLTFPYKPVFVFVCATTRTHFFLAFRGQDVTVRVNGGDHLFNYLSWGAKTLKWSILSDFGTAAPSPQMDEAGQTYHYFALMEVD